MPLLTVWDQADALPTELSRLGLILLLLILSVYSDNSFMVYLHLKFIKRLWLALPLGSERMHSSRMPTVRCSGHLSCHTHPLPCMPPDMHAPIMHAPCHAHPLPWMPLPSPHMFPLPLPCMPLPCHVSLPFAMHTHPLPCMTPFATDAPIHHRCPPPLPCTSPLWTEWQTFGLWKHYLSATTGNNFCNAIAILIHLIGKNRIRNGSSNRVINLRCEWTISEWGWRYPEKDGFNASVLAYLFNWTWSNCALLSLWGERSDSKRRGGKNGQADGMR